MLNTFLSGAIVISSWAVSLFFFRFQKTTKDRLFGMFAAAFLLLGFERICLEFMPARLQSHIYLIRLFAFLLILIAILDKNRKEQKP